MPTDNRTGQEDGMSRNGPNKTVAAARRKMGGFPERNNPARDPNNDPFMAFIFEQARAGVMFRSMEEAQAVFDAAIAEAQS